jgi:hypothetical protein
MRTTKSASRPQESICLLFPLVSSAEHLRTAHSPNIETCRVSCAVLGLRVVPITASTVKDSTEVLGTKIRCVLDRKSGD